MEAENYETPYYAVFPTMLLNKLLPCHHRMGPPDMDSRQEVVLQLYGLKMS
jgi:hypothetical protein